MHFKKHDIIRLLERVQIFATENLNQIDKLNVDMSNDYDKFFIGMAERQLTICNDLSILFTNKKSKFLTSELILFRCLADDYIHVTYLVNQNNVEESITDFNADAISKNFNKIKELAELNEKKLGGNYPFYPTYKLLEQVKEEMKSLPYRQQYFLDKDKFKFKTFKATGNLIRELNNESYAHKLQRAYFIWRKLSDFVHYSNFTFDEERSLKPETDETYSEFAELISYSYFTIKTCIEHFVNKFQISIIDSNNLNNYYKDAENR